MKDSNLTPDMLTEALKEVKDPELGIDIVTLGLIRNISIDEEVLGVRGAEVLMTMTSPFCPFSNEIIEDVENALEKAGVTDPRVEVTFDPPWEPSEELKTMLGI